jgi:hypothetical protein
VIRPEDAGAVLRLLGAAYPTYPVEPDTLELYTRELVRLPDMATLTTAASRWVETEDRYPTVHQLTVAYQAEARWRTEQARRADEQRALTRPGLPDVGASYAIEMIDVLRTATVEALANNRGHDHARGAAHCPVCSRSGEVAAAMEARVTDLLAARGIKPVPGPLVTTRCRCGDRGYVPVDTSEAGFTVRPCADCNTDAYELWQGGHLAPGHWCAECKEPAGARRR